MDWYLLFLILGGAGLGIMAATGLGRHGHDAAGGHGGHGHAGHVHGGHDIAHHGHDAHAHGHHGHHSHHGDSHSSPANVLLALASPRVLFSFLVGVGATGIVGRELGLRNALGSVVLAAVAVLGGVVFERFVVSPMWSFFDRFTSSPALTLESAVEDEAKAVTGFNRDGEGLVAVELDGQVVQVLARLTAGDRERGVRVRAGDRVRVEDVDAKKNSCTVSLL